jgi:putative oxidoreductase
MQNPLTTDGYRNVALLLARVALGTTFILAGYGKFAGGVHAFVDKAAPSIPTFLPPELGRAYLFMLPAVELITGVALVVGFYTRTAAFLMTLMLISFGIAVTGVGTAKPPSLDKGMVFLGLALVLMSTGGGQISVDTSMGGGGKAPGPKK